MSLTNIQKALTEQKDGADIPMAEPNAFWSMSPSQPSSSHGARLKVANEDKYRETELLEDTVVLHSSFIETQNTELVEDSDPVENMTSGPICEYEQQVVLDSEDEEMHSVEAVNVAKRLLDDETIRTVKNPSMGFQKRHPMPPSEQAEERAADSNAKSFRKAATGLNHIRSPEPGDSTQAALGFVDRYLSSNNVDMFQGIHHRKATREKSPHVPSARGPLSLAKKIKAQTQNEEKEPFKLLDSDQNDKVVAIFCKRIEESSNFESHRQTYVRRRQKKGGFLQNQENCSTGSRCDEKLVQGPGTVTENSISINELDVQSGATRENVNAYSSVALREDMSDIGLDTQMAAEAMEALAYDYVPLSGCHFNDVHRPDNALDDSLRNVAVNEAHLHNSSSRKNPGLQSIAIKSKKRNVFSCSFNKVTSSSSCKNTENQEPNTVSRKMKKLRESKSTIDRQFENNTSLPIHSEHVSLGEVCSHTEHMGFQPAAKEPKNWNNESRRTKIKDQPTNHTERNNNVKEEGITEYKRKVNGLVAETLKLDTETKGIKLPTNSCWVARKSRLNHQVHVSPHLSETSRFLRIDSWLYPKRPRGKRKRANVRINLSAPTSLCTQSVTVDGKESTVHSSRSLESQDDVDKLSFPHAHPVCSNDTGRCMLQGSSALPCCAGDAMQFENQHDTHPLLLTHVEISSTKSVAQSSPEIPAIVTSSEGKQISNAHHTYNEHHKNSCNKNLPKSSLLKELIRLGVSNSKSDLIWKDLRQRRDMMYIRVLLSQHLDDTVIKQQKKILARLNISIASCSMEATHFVADKFTRTKNMLETMALGKLVVTHLWLESCGQANCLIDEKNYILRDVKKEKEIGFSMPVSLARARQKPLLKGKRVYITPHIKPDKEMVANLVTAVHGQVVDESQICAGKNDNILDDLLILSCEDEFEICYHLLERGTAVYSSELLLNGIVIQRLDLERHQLFKNQVSRNKPSTFNRFGKVYRRR